MKTPRLLSATRIALIVAFGTGVAATASANSTGVTGASGKNNGFFCRNCHTGGFPPTVELAGPITLAPGATGTYTFTVTSTVPDTQIAAGLNIAASEGDLGVVDSAATRVELGEVTHNMPKENNESGQAIFEVTWQAPVNAGVYTLFASGTSVNLNDIRLGDGAARTELAVFVGVATPTPEATDTPLPTATATATPTPEAGACVGDCGEDGAVTVDEIITGVNIALGVTQPSMCPQFDPSGDGQVTVDEILQAVNAALTGC